VYTIGACFHIIRLSYKYQVLIIQSRDDQEYTVYIRSNQERVKPMRYEIKITENTPTWQWVNGASVAVIGIRVEVIVPAYSGYTTIYDRVARSDAEYKQAMNEAHREGADWKQHGLR
jgi:hypothetical protein